MGFFYIFTALHLNQQQICISESGNLCCCYVSKYYVHNFLCTTYFLPTAQLHIFWAIMKICWYIALKELPSLILHYIFIISRCLPIKMIRENNTGMDTYWKLSWVQKHLASLGEDNGERIQYYEVRKRFSGKGLAQLFSFSGRIMEKSMLERLLTIMGNSPSYILELHDILPSCCLASSRIPTGRKLIQY